eukprot:4038138-Amphidinium_carterae.2
MTTTTTKSRTTSRFYTATTSRFYTATTSTIPISTATAYLSTSTTIGKTIVNKEQYVSNSSQQMHKKEYYTTWRRRTLRTCYREQTEAKKQKQYENLRATKRHEETGRATLATT